MGQLDMFGAPERDLGRLLDLPALDPAIHTLGQALRERAPQLRLGTSSWTFPGWQGLLWDRPATTRLLAREGLATYARHPLLRSVGLDRTYYGPMTAEELAALRRGLPPDFRLLVKAHAECTTVRFADESWYRSRAGQRNELFLEPEYATQAVVEPFMTGLGEAGGVLLFQFPPQRIPGGARNFAVRLRDFLAALPRGPQVAVEVRNGELITPRYVRALEEVGATHCVVELPGMPEVQRQWEVTGGVDRPALVMRWMLARHHTYDSGREAYAPFSAMVDPNPPVRAAFAEMIAAQAQAKPKCPAYLIANNKAEGSSPLTLLRLAERLLLRLSDRGERS